jgi:hypothetical protein
MSVNPLIAAEAGKLLKEIIVTTGDYLKHRETEKTERARVQAALKVAIRKIEANKEVYVQYITSTFDEREKLYVRFDALLKKAIEVNDFETSKLAMQFMLDVYNRNPMEGFSLDNSLKGDDGIERLK